MSFGHNLQFLRKMHQGMTQDELAEKLGVSRQTISKWEMNNAFPEMEKAIALCQLFSCTLDRLIRENMDSYNEAYINMRLEKFPAFRYIRYAVISAAPEDDAQNRIKVWAAAHGIDSPEIIGWDFPIVSQEQTNVYHMHGYTAACILPEGFREACNEMDIIEQPDWTYAAITIREPFKAPFSLIPNAYQTLMRYIEVNHLGQRLPKEILPCFERVYEKDDASYMDVYIAVEN